MTERTKNIKERIDNLSKPVVGVKKHPLTLGLFLAILLIPVMFALFVGVLVLVLWFSQHPLDTTAMLGISIVLIGGYVTLLNPKRA